MLDDGTYDAIVVDADTFAAADGRPEGIRLEVVILAGSHKGEVVAVLAAGLRGDPIDRLGDPVTLSVAGGAPQITFDL